MGGLVQTLLSSAIGGDSSNWVGALGMSHYNMNDMPGLSFMVGQHLAQMMLKKRFTMFDFGSTKANIEAYGTSEPLDIGAHYGVIDIPVDVVAGRRDKLIPRSMVKRHYKTLKDAGCKASYDEFEYAHLDFTFSHKEELQAYVMSRLLLLTPPRLKSGDLRKTSSNKMRGSNKSYSKKSFRNPRKVGDSDGIPREEVGRASEMDFGKDCTSTSGGLDTDLPEYIQSQSELESLLNRDKEILSSVTAGSVATESHEESITAAQPFVPESFDDSSLFAFPSKEVVSIMSRRVSRAGLGMTDLTRIGEFNIQQGFDTCSIAGTSSISAKTPKPAITKESSSVFSRLTDQLFRRSAANTTRDVSSSRQTATTSQLPLSRWT